MNDEFIPIPYYNMDDDVFEFDIELMMLDCMNYMAEATEMSVENFEPLEVIAEFTRIQFINNPWTLN